jgi:hypothetical protein
MKPFVVAHRAVRSSPWPRPPRLVCPSVFALRLMNDQEYLRLTSPSLAPSASFDPSPLEAQPGHVLFITSGSACCSESVSESRAVTAAGSPSSISVSAVLTLDSTVRHKTVRSEEPRKTVRSYIRSYVRPHTSHNTYKASCIKHKCSYTLCHMVV